MMKNDLLLSRIEQEIECREAEQEVESREEFTVLFTIPDAPDAPDAPTSPSNPFPEPVCPFLYW